MDNIAQIKDRSSLHSPKHVSRYKQSYLENVQNHPSGRSKHLYAMICWICLDKDLKTPFYIKDKKDLCILSSYM